MQSADPSNFWVAPAMRCLIDNAAGHIIVGSILKCLSAIRNTFPSNVTTGADWTRVEKAAERQSITTCVWPDRLTEYSIRCMPSAKSIISISSRIIARHSKVERNAAGGAHISSYYWSSAEVSDSLHCSGALMRRGSQDRRHYCCHGISWL